MSSSLTSSGGEGGELILSDREASIVVSRHLHVVPTQE